MLAILIVLAVLAARLDAAPAPTAASMALARQYADALTGADRDEPRRTPPGLDIANVASTDDVDDASDEDGDEAAEVGDARADDDNDNDDDGDDGDDDDDDVQAGTGGDRDAGDATGGAIGQLALRDAEQSPPDLGLASDASAATAQAGAAELYESWMRRIRPSWWGRLDFGIAWRQRWTEPRYAPPTQHHELWLVATWRR